jgi:flagellar hook-length control protein FliK
MQFFPADITIPEGLDIKSTLPSFIKKLDPEKTFGNVLSSFIEEDRYDYTGRPAGFAAFGPEAGTIDYETAARIAKELRSRKVSELSVGQLESLAASGSPLTIGTVFNSLSGKTRLTEALSDAELESFMLVLDKLDFSKLEKEEMLALSDDGNTKGMWALLSGKLQGMDATADVSRKEWNALLRGLDSSSGNRKSLLELFAGEAGELEVRELTGAELEKMLAPLRGEYAEREQAAAYARTQARGAIVASFEAAKVGKNAAPVEDMRGSRHLEQKEALMQNSVRKNTGIDRIMGDDQDQHTLFKKAGHAQDHNTLLRNAEHGRDIDAEHDAEHSFEHGYDKKRFDRTPAAHSDFTAAARKSAEGGKSEISQAADTLLHTIHVATDAMRPELNPAVPVQNLNTIARNFRQEIFSQVEQGILSGTHNGTNRLTLQLNPVELGQVTVILSVHQGEVKAIIRAEQQESAGILREQMAELRASLEAEGLKVKELDVQTSLRHNLSADQWNGHREHNLMQDAGEKDRLMRLARIRRGTAEQADWDETPEVPATEQTGLHIVA